VKRTLTLRPAPARMAQVHKPVPPDPAKIALSQLIGLRYVSREGRYTQQVRIEMAPGVSNELTWVDVPLVPEVYG
jgi:hypothetical protein